MTASEAHVSTDTDSISGQQLADRLLYQTPPDGATESGCSGHPSFPSLEVGAVSLFIAFHIATLMVYSIPDRGLAAGVHAFFNRYLEMAGYMSLTGNATTWEMFAPDPPQANPFVRVFLEDPVGQVRDLGYDIYGRRQYPYLFFDRLAKINAWGLRVKENRTAYAAWACREWERAHGGEPARRVRLVRFLTEIPPPEVAYASGGYHSMLLDVRQIGQEAFECATLPHGQLSPTLRARYGLPPAPDGTFRDVQTRTWWHQVHGQLAATPSRASAKPAGATAVGDSALE